MINNVAQVKIALKVLETSYINHDVKRFVLEKPQGFTFVPGQSANVSINVSGWRNKLRPFTFTNLPDDNFLEFIIKIYRDLNGVTNQLERINAGDELIIHDVFGTIEFKGAGVFIAGGSGITPFLSIFRHLYKTKKIHGNLLIYTNRTSSDIIMEEELQKMLGDNFVRFFTRENIIGFIGHRVDRNFLIENITNFNQHFYLCGPEEFVNDINKLLQNLGASTESIIF